MNFRPMNCSSNDSILVSIRFRFSKTIIDPCEMDQLLHDKRNASYDNLIYQITKNFKKQENTVQIPLWFAR